MAIYHLHAKVFKRSAGRNAVASAAYRRATQLFDQKEQKTWGYTSKPDVIHSELLVPENAPDWAKSLVELHQTHPDQAAEQLWNLVEATEKRKDAQLAREVQFALPIELNQEQNIQLAREFIKDQFVLRGMIADWNIHWDPGNPHVHVMLSMRELTEDGFGLKVRDWNRTSLLEEWRQQWAEYANFHLRLHRHDMRIDHRSYKDQGIGLVPTIHQGKAVSDMDNRGITTDLMVEANAIRRDNLERIAANPDILLHKLGSQSSTFTQEQLGKELGRYINDQGKFSVQEQGILSEAILQDLTVVGLHDDEKPVLTVDHIAKILKSIEHHESVFTDRDIAKAVEPFTAHAEQFARAVIELKASPQLIRLGAGDDGRDRFTTKKLFALENEIQQVADHLRNQRHVKIPAHRIHDVLKKHQAQIGKELTLEQREALEYITKPTSISCLVGRAGTGKSFLLGAAKKVWEAQGLRVQGIALSGIAADGLNKDAGISSRTIDSFRYAISKEQLTLNRHDVIVMDEAGMTDSVSMMAVLKAIQKARAKLVLVGDHAQLQPVGPGAIFRALVERLNFKEIQTVYRQKDWQAQATVDFSSGDMAKGLDAYEAQGCIHLEKTADMALSRLVNDWLATRANSSQDLSQYLVIAHRNEDVNQLNTRLRAERVEREEIAEGYSVQTVRGNIRIAQGDRLLFLKNDRRLGVNNGRFATIKSVRFIESGKVIDFIVTLDGTDKEVLINPEKYADFAYGYAATVHKVQGMTVDHAFVYAGGFGWNRHLTYVALSRHRESCYLYADQETHQNQSTLTKRLGQFGIKDSLLDFPLAFAERRGIDTSGLLKMLPQHLAKRLATWKTKLSDQVQEWLDPITHAERIKNQVKAEAIAERREDSRLVASYADLNRKVGSAWQALQTKMHTLGLDKLFGAQAFQLIAGTEEYRNFQRAMQDRNAKASQVMAKMDYFEIAIDRNGIDRHKLKDHADRHACFERVNRYRSLSEKGQIVLRDDLAAEIMASINSHYGYLKNAHVDTKELKQQSIDHLRRELFKTLTPEERVTFRVVERYRLLSQQAGALWSTEVKAAQQVPALEQKETTTAPDLTVRRSLVDRFNKLSQARDRLAYQIVNHRDLYDKALDFYQIGIAKPHFGEPTTETLQQQAEARWYRLQQYAAREVLRERVKAYQQALFVGDLNTRLQLAHKIKQESKAHHGSVINLGANVKEIWYAISRDAKLFARRECFQNLDLIDRLGFKAVEAYVDAKHAHGNAWRELLMCKEGSNLDEKSFYARLAPYAAHYTQLRNQLAAKIVENPTHYQAGLDYFEIKAEELKPQAYAHQCRVDVENYLHAPTLLLRAQQALTVVADPKAHHGIILEKGLTWRAIYRDARIAERQEKFSELTYEEKTLHRLADRYRQANQRAGKLFSEIKSKTQDKALSKNDQIRVDRVFARRDYFAWRLINNAKSLDSNGLSTLEKVCDLTPTKLLIQQAKIAVRLESLNQWEALYEGAFKATQQFHDSMKRSDAIAVHTLDKALNAVDTALQFKKNQRLNLASPHLNYALQAQGLSSKQFVQQLQGIAELKEHLPTLAQLNKMAIKPATQAQPVTLKPENTYQKIDVKRLREDLNAQAAQVTQHYLGNPKSRSGSVWRYGSNQGSLVVNVGGTRQGLWRDFQTSEGGDMLSLIKQALETSDFKTVLQEATHFLGGTSRYTQPQPQISTKTAIVATPELDAHTQEKIQKAQAIAQATQPIAGTLAERYLREHRGISIDLKSDNLRFHPNLKNWMTKENYPALVITARNEKNEVCGVQAIFLDPKTAKKAPLGQYTKLSRGLIGQGAVIHVGETSDKVAFAEGVETALSVASAHPDWTVYTTFGVANFDKAPLKAKRSDIILCADNDGRDSGTANSVERATNILAQKGINVWVAKPDKPEHQKKWDFNDALMTQGVSQVKSDLDHAKLSKKAITQDSIAKKISSTLEKLNGKVTKEVGINQLASNIENRPYEDVLAQYINMEIKQTELTQAMYTARFKDPKAGRELATQALAHSHHMKAFAAKIAEHPAYKAEIEQLKKETRPASLAQRGGFNAIAERLKEGKMTPEDVKTVTLQVRNKTSEHARSQTQDRDRGGRSK